MDREVFDECFRKLKDIWEQKTPEKIVDICADSFLWYETQFDAPLETKEELLDEWRGISQQDNIHVSCDVLSTTGNMGLAHWHAIFTKLSSREQVELDGIFQVFLDKNGKCTEFHQWRSVKN